MFGTNIPKLMSLLAALSVLISSLTGYSSRSGQGDPTLEPPAWPAWVHTHWIWEHVRY